jgi:peptidyl-prolyl cis-trans isomerase D
MLQSLRENMKGPTAKIVVGLAVAAMVLFGVESLFVNSVGGSEVATVNGEDISRVELQRAIEQQKSRLRQQYELADSDELLSDERLSAPTLMNLIRQKALQQTAYNSGMNVAPEIIKAELAEAFTRDGQFSAALLNNYIASYGYTPATLAKAEASSYVLRQLFNGINQSEFVTQLELDTMAAIAGQKRSFGVVSIPRSAVLDKVVLSDADIENYYNSNNAQFTEPEKIAIEYIELSVKNLAKQQTVTQEEIREEYERERSEYASETEYRISHILIEPGSNSEEKLAELTKKIENGEDFSQLAQDYSDDLGSKAQGGSLGEFIEGAYPNAFEKAVLSLEQGNISGPVKTEAGTHFIKLDQKIVTEPPSFESREQALAAILKEQKAGATYLDQIQRLEETSFGSADLTASAEALSLSIESTPLFSRGQGTGVAALPAIVEAAYDDEVYNQGRNSAVIESDGERAFVIRIKNKVPPTLKPLAEVKAAISQQLTDAKVAAELELLASDVEVALKTGKNPDDIAKSAGYLHKEFVALERSSTDVDFMISREVFSMPRPAAKGAAVISTVEGPTDINVIALTEVVDGAIDSLPEEQRIGINRQLREQLAMGSAEAFENRVFESAKYKLK